MARFTWLQDTSGDWTDPSNWQNDAVPGAADFAYIPTGFETQPVVTTAISVGSISNSGVLSFNDAGTCAIAHNFANKYTVYVNGTQVKIGGTLENTNALALFYIAPDASAKGSVVATAVDNEGELNIDNRGVLDVLGSASFGTAATVTGAVNVYNGLIEFAGTSQINTIAAGALLDLQGTHAFVAAAGLGLTSNSALKGLQAIDGELDLINGAAIDTVHRLAVGAGGKLELEGGTLEAQGVFTNDGFVVVLPTSSLKLDSTLVNDGGMLVSGYSGQPGHDQFVLGGDVSNNGTMTFREDTEEFAHEFVGSGTIGVGFGANLTFDDTVGSHQQFYFGKSATLGLADPGDFHGAVETFVHNDAFLIHAFDASTTFNFIEASGGHGGYLNVADGSNGSAHIYMRGTYDNGDFSLTTVDGGVKIASTR